MINSHVLDTYVHLIFKLSVMRGNPNDKSKLKVGADGNIRTGYFGRVPDLHPHDPYWDDVDGVWRRTKDDSYDEEANDLRPDSEKYSNYPVVVISMLVVFGGLLWLLIHIMKNLG